MKYIDNLRTYMELIDKHKSFGVVLKANWCGPCQRQSAVVNEIQRILHYPFYFIDVDKCEPDVLEFLEEKTIWNMNVIPITIFYHKGEFIRHNTVFNYSTLYDVVQALP